MPSSTPATAKATATATATATALPPPQPPRPPPRPLPPAAADAKQQQQQQQQEQHQHCRWCTAAAAAAASSGAPAPPQCGRNDILPDPVAAGTAGAANPSHVLYLYGEEAPPASATPTAFTASPADIAQALTLIGFPAAHARLRRLLLLLRDPRTQADDDVQDLPPLDPATGFPLPTAQALFMLQFCFQTAVAYDNVSVYERPAWARGAEDVPIRLAFEALFRKVFVRRRGGFCMELNIIFGWLLTALNFHAELRSGDSLMGAVSYDPSTHPLTDLRHPGTHLLNLVHLPVTLRGAPHWWIADVGCSSKSSCTPFPLWSGDNLGAAQGLICGGHVGFVRPRVLWPPAGSVGLPEGFEVPQECCVVYFRVMEEAEKRRIEAMAVEAAAAERGAAGGFGEAAAEAASSSERDGDGFLRSLPGWWQLCVRTSQWARVQSALSAAPSDAEVTAAMLAARERGGGAGGSTSDRFFRFAPARQPTRAVVAAILREMSRPEWTVPVPGHAGLLCRAATDGGRAVMVGTRAGGYKCVVRSWAGAEVDRFEIGGGRVWRGKKKDAAREEAEEEAEAARGEDVDVPRRNFELFKALAKQVFGVEGLDAGDV